MADQREDRPDPADLAALGMTEAEFMRNIAIGEEISKRLKIKEPRAVAVTFKTETQAVCFTLQGGASVTLPLAMIPLDIPADADVAKAFAVAQIDDCGEYVYLDTIQEAITVPGTIINALYDRVVWRAWSEQWGSQYEAVRSQVMAEYGRKGGKAKSAAKAAAARANGAKGGRPRKNKSA